MPKADNGLIRKNLQELFNSLFTEACARRSALASLEFGIALANYIERTFTLHHLAISVAAFH